MNSSSAFLHVIRWMTAFDPVDENRRSLGYLQF